MLKRRSHAAALAALTCAWALAGCDDAPPEQPKGTGGKKVAAGPKAASLSSEMVSAVSSGKTASVISVHFALGAPPTVGKPLPVKIVIVPHRKFLSVRAHFETHDGITMTAGGAYGPKIDAEAETVLQHDLMLVPVTEGLFMVTTIVDTEGEEGSVSRVFSIPVIVSPAQGTPAAPAPAEPAPPAAAAPAIN